MLHVTRDIAMITFSCFLIMLLHLVLYNPMYRPHVIVRQSRVLRHRGSAKERDSFTRTAHRFRSLHVCCLVDQVLCLYNSTLTSVRPDTCNTMHVLIYGASIASGLDHAWKQRSLPCDVVSYPGQTTTELLANMPERMGAGNFTHVVLVAGTNDERYTPWQRQHVADNLAVMCNIVHKTRPSASIVVCSLKDDVTNELLKFTNATLHTFLHDHIHPDMMHEDGVHLSEQGKQTLSAQLLALCLAGPE